MSSISKDPGNPRFRDGGPGDVKKTVAEPEFDLVDHLARLMRGLCIVGVFGLLLVAAYLAINVFFQIGSLIQHPEQAKASVEAIAELISAESLSVVYAENETLNFGNLVSFLLLLFCYILWLYVPATLISVCSRILLGTLTQKKQAVAGKKQ